MVAKRSSLGRGLGALIKDTPDTSGADDARGIDRIPLNQISKSPWQPRRHFAPDAIEDLVQSIRERGVLQPLLVRKLPDGNYELIAGERRFRASQVAELEDVPVIIMDVSDREALELALIENLQREDLNLIEEAEGYQVLIDKFDMTQEHVAERVGKARATVANALRLLQLPDKVKQYVAENRVTPGHAKAILGLEIPAEQELLADRVAREGLSVRAVEKIVGSTKKTPKKPRAEKADIPASHLRDLTERLQQVLGTGVHIAPTKTLSNGKKAKGHIAIDYYSNEDLDRLLAILGLTDSF